MKDFMSDVSCAAARFGSNTADAAKRVGRRTTDIAEDIGLVRGLIGLAVLGAAIGGTIVAVRYVRAKRAEQLVDIEPANLAPGEMSSQQRGKRGKHAHANAPT